MACELAAAGNLNDPITVNLLDRAGVATREGRLEEARSLFRSFRRRKRPAFNFCSFGKPEYRLAQFWLLTGELTEVKLKQAESVATEGRNLWAAQVLATLRSEWNLLQGDPVAAMHAIEYALSIMRRIGVPAPRQLGLRALALARIGRTAESREALAEAEETWNSKDAGFPVVASEAWLALNDHARARDWVRWAYPLAWAEGPPHVEWYELKRCRELMAMLGEPEPELPPFDPSKVERVPFEAEIRAVIEELKAEKAKKAKQTAKRGKRRTS